MAKQYKRPSIPFVQARHSGKKQKPKSIALYVTDTTSDKGAALAIANYHHSPIAPPTSYHYILDAHSVYRCVPERTSSTDAIPKSISILMCAELKYDAEEWLIAPQLYAFFKAADLVSDLVIEHKIPLRYLQGPSLLKWLLHPWRKGGIIISFEGAFPKEELLSKVKQNLYFKSYGKD